MTNFTNITFLLSCFLFIELTTKIHSSSQQNLLRKSETVSQTNILSNQKERILYNSTQPFQINYVIVDFLRKYDSRNSFCRYLCQSDDIFSFFEVQSCYQTYKCNSLILHDLLKILYVVSYVVLPIFMITTGIWSFNCFTQYIAIFTGVICLSSLYNKIYDNFEENMKTEYDISTQSDISHIKKPSEIVIQKKQNKSQDA